MPPVIYVEFIEREAGIPREIFRYIGDQSGSWVQAARDRRHDVAIWARKDLSSAASIGRRHR